MNFAMNKPSLKLLEGVRTMRAQWSRLASSQVRRAAVAYPHATQPRTPPARTLVTNASAQPITQAATSWLKDFLKSKLNIFIAGAVGLIAVNFLATEGYNLVYKRSVLKTLREGVLPPPAPPAALPRDALRAEMRSIMTPERPTRFFSVILGAPGSGKTTLVRAACREMGGGVGYVDVSPAVEDFGRDLGDAFNFKLEKHVNVFNIVSQAVIGSKTVDVGSSEKLGVLRRSAEALHEAAQEYRHRTGTPFVLVVDSVDRLCQAGDSGNELLRAFVQYSKDWAQDGSIVVVFVTSTWDAAKRVMGEHPTQGRAGVPLQIGPLSDAEAGQLLRHLGVPDDTAAKCIELVGGSLLLLERAAGLCVGGADFAKVKAKLTELMEAEFEAAGLLSAEAGEEGTAAVRALLSSPGRCMSADDFRAKVKDAEQRKRLLNSGVMHYDGKQVTFSSKLAETCATEFLTAKPRR